MGSPLCLICARRSLIDRIDRHCFLLQLRLAFAQQLGDFRPKFLDLFRTGRQPDGIKQVFFLLAQLQNPLTEFASRQQFIFVSGLPAIDGAVHLLVEAVETVYIDAFHRHAAHASEHGAFELLFAIRQLRSLLFDGIHLVNKEIDEGERQLNAAKSKNGKPSGKPIGKAPKADHREAQRDQRKIRKEITNCERSIARLDEQKRGINAQLLQATDPKEALRLHNELEVITAELAEAEQRWCELQQQQTADE